MVFSSTIFLFLFLPVVLALAIPLRPVWAQNAFLLAASLLFYAWGESYYIGAMLICMGINYVFSLALAALEGRPTARKWALGLAIACNLGVLIFYKYTDFIIAAANWALAPLLGITIAARHVHLPLGVSFFTFHAISYVVDVYRGHAKAERNPLNMALYIALFPQLVAGPIVRFRDIAERIRSRRVSLRGFSEGVERFVIGLAKKTIIANPLGAVADQIFSLPPDALNFSLAWLGAVAYTFQIYFDFSGYSDMAIGLGKMLGFRFPENFNYPYISRSIKEFWRRWHITLSSWFRDYLYIPLGGSKKGPWRTYANLVTVFFLCGLWHGASWTFVAWGLYHGFFLVLERAWPKVMGPLAASWTGRLYALPVVVVGWVIFRADNAGLAAAMLGAMAGFGAGDGLEHNVWILMTPSKWLLLALGALCSTPFWKSLKNLHRRWPLDSRGAIWARGAILAGRYAYLMILLIISAGALALGAYNPFIYFRF